MIRGLRHGSRNRSSQLSVFIRVNLWLPSSVLFPFFRLRVRGEARDARQLDVPVVHLSRTLECLFGILGRRLCLRVHGTPSRWTWADGGGRQPTGQ